MPKKIDLIRAKVTRANQHIQDFQLAVRAFNKTRPYVVRIKEDAESGKRIYYLSKVDEVPVDIATVAADTLQNLRSALDQCAFQLEVIGNGGAEPKHLVYFPIADSAAKYASLRSRYIKFMRQDAIDAIDATEPYNGGKGHRLWQLHALNKTDKHRLLFAAGGFFESVDIAVEIRGMAKKAGFDIPKFQLGLRPADKLLSLKVGDELYIESIESEVYKDRQFTFDVSFDKPGVIECEPAVKTLQDMANLVDSIIGSLANYIK